MMEPLPGDWYETPLFYDIVFDEDTEKEADFLEGLCRRHGHQSRPGRVLEPACGSGRLVTELARRGWRASGFDSSPEMLSFAREKLRSQNLKARLWQDRMEDFTPPGKAPAPFDLAHCLVSTFKYLPREADAESCLRHVARSLRPGGLFVLGLHLTDYEETRCHHERWIADRDGIEVICNTRTWPPDRRRRTENLRTRLQISLPDGSLRKQETRWTFRTYSSRQLRRLLNRVSDLLDVAACHDFHYDLERERALDDEYADLIVVLRRREQ